MGCSICGRSSCVKTFHSIEEQETFDGIAVVVVDKIKQSLNNKLYKLKSTDNKVDIDEVNQIIEDLEI